MNSNKTNKILLVEDDNINQNVMQLFLKRFGYQTDTASNGKEAVKLARENIYQLVIMDCQMPFMDGFEATKLIKNDSLNKLTNVLALTANVDRKTRDRCIDSGMIDVMYKPVNMAEIRQYIEKYIQTTESN